jgi:hypothetical protein
MSPPLQIRMRRATLSPGVGEKLSTKSTPIRRWEGDMVQLRVVPLCEAKGFLFP